MLIIKTGVMGYCKTGCVRPEIWKVIAIAENIFSAIGKDCVVTSLCDGKHSKNSKHYEGNAIDLRNRHLTSAEYDKILALLANELGTDYDVVPESDHIHIEYDPKEVHNG